MSVENLATSMDVRLALRSPRVTAKQLQDTRNPRRHPYSLIDVSQHDAALVQLVGSPVTLNVVRFLIKTTENVIRIRDDFIQAAALPSPPITPVKGTFEQQQAAPSLATQDYIFNHPDWPPLDQFIFYLVRNSRSKMNTLLVTLVYLHRLKLKLPLIAQGENLLTMCRTSAY